jgi:hypothetical protein
MCRRIEEKLIPFFWRKFNRTVSHPTNNRPFHAFDIATHSELKRCKRAFDFVELGQHSIVIIEVKNAIAIGTSDCTDASTTEYI